MELEQKHTALLVEASAHNLPGSENIRLCFETLSLAAAIDRDCATRLGRHGVSEGRFVLLFLLRSAPNGLSPFALAEKAGITRATVTGLLDGLQKAELITRRHDAHDRRMVTVRLTPSGRRLAEQLFEEHGRWIASLFANFTAEEKATLSGLLARAWRNTDAGMKISPPAVSAPERQRIRIPYNRKEQV